ncbi:putative membrane protein YeiH [Chitinivorax tropicus]|uniref:Putative membrane protein YeiH n=1 Tax=Chitinivorax tropicus TaxID=714531 RepID=A0A840MQU8_9PROT|nr:trimeric intracellular cation channel family protein [Chitinivorax tropicus]MBB5019152.1 putative membrane protein YeiH [Chitinivorax tropicus]
MLYLFDLLGCAIFAFSGALAAGRAKLDWLGVMIIATITAIGGGTVRDLLMNRHPIFWMQDPCYLYLTCLTGLATIAYVQYLPIPYHVLLVADALGLALFAIYGAQLAAAAGHRGIIVIVMGTMTGTAGGVIRDILSNQIPLILRKDIYASAAIVGIGIYLLLKKLKWRESWAFVAGFIAVVSLRLLALTLNWQLPVFNLR